MSHGEEQATYPGGERNYFLQMGQQDLSHSCDLKDKYCQVMRFTHTCADPESFASPRGPTLTTFFLFHIMRDFIEDQNNTKSEPSSACQQNTI